MIERRQVHKYQSFAGDGVRNHYVPEGWVVVLLLGSSHETEEIYSQSSSLLLPVNLLLVLTTCRCVVNGRI